MGELSPRPSLPLTSSYAPAVTPGLWGCVLLYFYSFGLVLLCLPQSSVYGISSAYIHLELLDFSRVFRSTPSGTCGIGQTLRTIPSSAHGITSGYGVGFPTLGKWGGCFGLYHASIMVLRPIPYYAGADHSPFPPSLDSAIP